MVKIYQLKLTKRISSTATSDPPCLLHWRLLIQFIFPNFLYLSCESNLASDDLSLLSLSLSQINQETSTHEFLHDTTIFYPYDIGAFPLDFVTIYTAQHSDPMILDILEYGIYKGNSFYVMHLKVIEKKTPTKIC